MLKRMKDAAIIAIIATWIAAAFSNAILDNTYVGYPRVPDPKNHLVIPYYVKGIVVYVTSGQMEVLLILRYITIGAGILMAALIVVYRVFPLFKK